MVFEAKLVGSSDIAELRDEFRQAANCQIVRFTNLPRGFAYPIGIEVAGELVAYGAIRTTDEVDTFIEFYARPAFNQHTLDFAESILQLSSAGRIEAQTNLPDMLAILTAFGVDRTDGPLLFAAGEDRNLEVPDAIFRRRSKSDQVFEHSVEPVGDWLIEYEGQVVATGGYLTHYNPPYADLFMEVEPASCRRGFGSFLLQEIRRQCTAEDLIAAARCDADNEASARCLLRSGMTQCGKLVQAKVSRRTS